MSSTTAIVTLAIGTRYLQRWKRLCQANWRQYAEKYGFDLICLDSPIDDSERARKRSPAWQKCLILTQDFAARYERIVWVDADILINPASPCIVQDVPLEKVGAVDEYSSPTPEQYRKYLQVLYRFWEARGVPFIRNETAEEYYRQYGLPLAFPRVVQAGVMVLSPRHHRQILEETYFSYEEKGSAIWNYEMRPLSYELLKADCVHWLDYRFNTLWTHYQSWKYPTLRANPKYTLLLLHPKPTVAKECAARAFTESYFLHFAGCREEEMAAVCRAINPAASPPPAKRAVTLIRG
jgi:hypothetical protein